MKRSEIILNIDQHNRLICPCGAQMRALRLRDEFKIFVGKRRHCWCGWSGKEACECHDGKKLEEFPEPDYCVP